jgi:hypothetical protein
MLIAVAHIIGSIVSVFAFGFAVLALGAWEQGRNRKAAVQEASIALGISPDEIENPEHTEKVIRFSSERFSSELFRNRLSDLLGFVSTAWGWLGTALQVAALCGVIWYSFSDAQLAIHSWWVLAIAVFFWVVSVVFALACKLVTGRYPGQARQARQMLGKLLEARRSALASGPGDAEDDAT